MNTKAQAILESARLEAMKVETWADLSNFLFAADYGLISKAYPVGPERSAFLKSEEYKEIRKLINEVRERTGVIEGATPKRLGRVAMDLPLPLCAALETEATRAGVSFNQLVVERLTMHTPSPFTAK